MSNIWTFIAAADMQPGSPKSFRYQPAFAENWRTARRQIIERKPEFLLIAGDVTRDGSIHPWELKEMKADLDGMGLPYRAIPGNMDTGNKHADRQGAWDSRDDVSLNITANQVRRFETVFGPTSWTFDHKNVRVSGFCDMLLGSGLPEEQTLWNWLEEQAERPKAEHSLWLMHYAMFIDRPDEPAFDMTKNEEYAAWYFCIDQGSRDRLMGILRKAGTTRVITGHVHCRKEYVVDGIHFDLAPGIAMGQWGTRWPDGDATLGFLEYTVDGKRMDKRFVPLESVSKRSDGYGPGGHPKPEARDYSLAREKRPSQEERTWS
jgi:hypothetical protein